MTKYALHRGLIDSFDFDQLRSTRKPLHDLHSRWPHTESLGKKTNARIVRLSIHRRSRQPQLIFAAQFPRERRFFGPRLHLYRETCSGLRFVHFTSARRLATPAAVFASTTSNAIASSTQSWLDPSAFCVATVSVYSCDVSQQSKLNS